MFTQTQEQKDEFALKRLKAVLWMQQNKINRCDGDTHEKAIKQIIKTALYVQRQKEPK